MADTLDEILAAADKKSPLDEIISAAETAAAPVAPQPTAGEPTGLARFLGMMNRGGARAVGLLGAPVIEPFTRPQPGDPGYEEFQSRQASQGIMASIDEALGRSRDAAERFATEQLGIVQPNLPAAATTIDRTAEALPAGLIGAGAFQTAATVAAPFARGATSAVGRAFGNLTGEIAARPVTSSVINAGSVPGQTFAREFSEPYLNEWLPGTEHPIAAAAGRRALSFIAETVGSAPTALAARALAHPFIPASERFTPVPEAAAPILPRTASPENAGNIARVHSARTIDFVDRAIARIIQESADPNLPEAVASRRLRGGLLVARDFVERSAQRAYRDVPDEITGNPRDYGDILVAMRQHAAEYPGEAQNVPLRLIDEQIRQLATSFDEDGLPITWRENVPIWELNRLRSVVMNEAWDAAENTTTGSSGGRALKVNLDILTDNLTNTISHIGSVNPEFQARLDYANSLWRLYNDRFRRGVIGDLLITNRHQPLQRPGLPEPPPGSAKVPASLVGREMLDPNETATAVQQAVQLMANMTGNTTLAQAVQSGVMGTGDDVLRVMFRKDILDVFQRQQARSRKPAAASDISTTYSLQREPVDTAVYNAQKWMQEHAPLIENWVRTTSALTGTISRITRLLAARDEHTQSLVGQFLGRNAIDVVEAGLRSSNPRTAFQSLYRTLRTNPEFMEGIQRALFDSLTRGDGANPNVALARLQTPRFRAAFETMFADRPGDLDRLFNILRDTTGITGRAVRAARGEASLDAEGFRLSKSLPRRMVQGAGTWLAGIAGLLVGNVAARVIPLVGGAGSLSIPMQFKRQFRDIVASTWVQDQVKALNFVKEAVFDPRQEAWLRNNTPGNFTDAKAQYLGAVRNLRRIEAATNEDVDALLLGGYDREKEDRRRIQARARQQATSPFGSQK